ncbi:unnamed protein product [Lymnaea stagnalis]|uniref:CENP-T/Histone H4 histone fold domain-containing protein n=1 Tax=Lymnaea stagnalis TaxID=6523 RepID=A0AAV2I3K9_LYMST
MDAGTSSGVKRHSSRIGEQRKYPGSGQKPTSRRSFRTPVQTVPLKSDGIRPERSASKSFVLIPDQNEKETPRSLIQGFLADSKTQSLTHVNKKSKLSLTPVEKGSTFKVPRLTDMVLRNQTQALPTAPATTPSIKYTPRTNIWNLLMDDVETTQADRTQSIEKPQASKSHLSELQQSDWGQRVTLSPLYASHHSNSTPVTHEESVLQHTTGVRTRKRFILEQAAKAHAANKLSRQSASQPLGHEDLSGNLGVNSSKTSERIEINGKFDQLHKKLADKKNMSAAAPTPEPQTADLSVAVDDEEADQPAMNDSEKVELAVERTIIGSVSVGHGSSTLEAPHVGVTTPASKKLQSSGLSHASRVNNDPSSEAVDDLPAQQPATSVYDIIEGSTSEDEQNSKTTGSVKKRMPKRKRSSSSMNTLVRSRKNLSQLTSDQTHEISPPASPFTRSKQNKTNTRVMTPSRNITVDVTHALRSSTPVPRKGFLHSTKVHETNSSSLSMVENNFMEYSGAPHITDLSPIRPDTRFQNRKELGVQEHLIDEVPSDKSKNQEDIALQVAGRNQDYNESDAPSGNENYNEPDSAQRNQEHTIAQDYNQSDAPSGNENYSEPDSAQSNQEHTISVKLQERAPKAPHNQHVSVIDAATRSHENGPQDVPTLNKEHSTDDNRLRDHTGNLEQMTQAEDHQSMSEVTKDYKSKIADVTNPQHQNEDDVDKNSQEVRQGTSLPSESAEYTELPSGISPLPTPDSNLTNRKNISAIQLQRRQSKNKISGGAKPSNANQEDPKTRKPRRKLTAKPTALPRKSVKFFAERHSSTKLSPDAIDEIVKVSEIWWDDTFKALEAYALHAGRKVINEKDVILLMKTQRVITGTEDLYDKIREYLPMELRTELIPIAKF